MHGIWSGVTYTDPTNGQNLLAIESLDAAVVAPGPRLPGLAFGQPMPALENGMNFCLFNNAW
jgi:hypothetical protein